MDARVVGVAGLAVEPVGVRALLGGDDPLADLDARPDCLVRGRPGDDDSGRRVVPPGQVDLLGRAVGAGSAGALAGDSYDNRYTFSVMMTALIR